MKRYTFNGEGYRSEEEANAARDSYIQKQHAEAMQRAYAQNADMASVGYDQNRYNMLMASGNGLSQMTTAESDFIKNRWQPDATTKYKNSATDQYLASIGLPPSSELNKYRTKYTEYNATGSLQDNYSGVDDRAWNKIKELWAKDWQYGQTDEDMRRRANGLAPESYDSMYTDTLLDDQLKAAGLPPSKLMNGKLGEAYNEWAVSDNKYRSIYDQIAKENAKHIRDNDGTSFEDVVMSVLSSPDNLGFVNAHYGELEDMPVLESDAYKLTEKKNGVTIDVKDSEGNQLYDDAKWRKDYIKASTKNAAITGDDFGITFDSIQKYWDENAVYYNAELAAEDYFKRSGVIPSEDQFMEKLGDFATAQSINDGAGFTVQNIFGEDVPEDKLETYQPFVTKLNQLLTEEGYSAAYNYLTGGEFASDMRAVQEKQWIADYRTEFADVPEALNKTDDEILDIYYGKFSTTYGMDESQIKAVRNGDLTVNGYMTDKVKTDADARQFAQDRRTRELEAAGLPTTREELEAEKKRVNDLLTSIPSSVIAPAVHVGYNPTLSKEEKDKLNRRLLDIDGALKHWYDLETEYFIDAMSYTQDFKDKTANMDEVNRQFYKIVSETHNAITDKQAENLVKHATDEEKRQLVYLYNTPEYTNQYEPDVNTGRNIAVYKRQDYLNNVLMRRWDSIEKGEQIAAQRNGGFGWDDALNAALTGGLSALSAINMGENSSAFGRTMRGIGGTLAAVTTQPFEAVANLLSDSVSMIAGKDIYASQRTSTWADNEISIIANRISEDHGENWAKAYQLMPSMIQSTGGAVLSYFTGGASEALTLALMSTQAYSSTVENALLNGASTKEAFWFGIASGAAEAFFEKFSLEALTEGMKGIGDVVEKFGGAGRKKLAVEIGKFLLSRMPISGGTEGSEELFTSAANDLAELLILTYDSSQEKLRRHYLDAGLSPEEADKRVMDDCLKALAFDAAAGFASGALMSFGSNLVAAGTSIRQDGIRINDFVNTAQNLSGISYDDAIALAKEYAQTDTSNNLTLDGARSVVEALRARGADSTTIARVVNELTDKNTQNDVMTYLNNQVAQQQLDDKIKLVAAAEKVLTRSNTMNLGAEAISAYVNQYANEILEATQKGSSENLEKIMRQMQRGFIDETVRRSGAYHAAGATAIAEYVATLDDANKTLIKEEAKRFKAKFEEESSGLKDDAADSYALYASALMHLTNSHVQDADFVRASTFLFGKSASSIPTAIRNACLNSDGKGARAFIDAALTAIAMHDDSDTSILMNQMAVGMSAPQFAVSMLALASQRKAGSDQRAVYDYIVKHGATESALNLLAATVRYEAMNGNARAAAEKVYASNRSDAVMTSDQSKALADEHLKLWQDYNAKKEAYEQQQNRNDVAMIDAEARVARYQAEYDAFSTDTVVDESGNVVPAIPVDMKEAAERTNDALQRAIEARNKLAEETKGKLGDAKKDMDGAYNKLVKFEGDYNTKLNRQTVAFVKHMGQFIAAMKGSDAPTRAAVDRETALFTHGTAENLNDIERKMIDAEKTKAVALGDAIGVKVEVVTFDDDFCAAHNLGKNGKFERGFEQGAKVFLNDLMIRNTDKAQYRGIKSVTGYYTDYVLTHEFGHVAERSTGKYSKYYKFALDYMKQYHGEQAVDGWINKIMKERNYSRAKAEREIVAEFTRTALLTDPRAINALCSKAPVMATRIYQWLNKVGGNIFNDTVAQSELIAKAQVAYAKALKAPADSQKMQNQTEITAAKDAFKEANVIEEAADMQPKQQRVEEAPTPTQAQPAKAQEQNRTEQAKPSQSSSQQTRASADEDSFIPEPPPESVSGVATINGEVVTPVDESNDFEDKPEQKSNPKAAVSDRTNTPDELNDLFAKAAKAQAEYAAKSNEASSPDTAVTSNDEEAQSKSANNTVNRAEEQEQDINDKWADRLKSAKDRHSNTDISHFTEFDELDNEIGNMTDTDFAVYGSPHMVVSSNGLMVRRLASADGYFSGNVTSGGERKIAMIAPADKFMSNDTPILRMPLSADDCYAIVVPQGKEYADIQTDARERGLVVVTYDENEPTQFEAAQQLAAESEQTSYFLSDDLTYEGFLNTFGQIRAGEDPRVDRPVPRRTSKDNRVSRAFRTMMEAQNTTEETASDMRSWMVQHGVGTYVPQSNIKSIEKANKEVKNYGSLKAAASALHGNVASGTGRNTDLVAQAEVLFTLMQTDNTLTDAEREGIVADLCILATDSGRATQLISAIKKMTPDGHILYIEQVGRRMASRYEKRTNKPVDLSLTEEEKQAYRTAKTQEERDAIDEQVIKRFADMTSDLTFIERMHNWRYFAMLANARTHMRNFVGNSMMYPIVRAKDSINALYQMADVSRSSDKHPTLEREDMTSTVVTRRADDATRAYVENLTKEAIPIMQGVSSKYVESLNKAAKSAKEKTTWQKLTEDVDSSRLFNVRQGDDSFFAKVGRAFNKMSSINTNALELEDALFLGLRFKSSVYQQIQAKGLDVSKMSYAQRTQVMNHAMNEALRATFRDASVLADAINEFAQSGKAQELITEGFFPFKKTPVNIAKRSIEYSPIGLIQGLYKMISNNANYKTQLAAIDEMKSNNPKYRDYKLDQLNKAYIQERIAAIDRLASGTTGSILAGIGILAASLGWISVKRKDDEADTFENGLGKSRYSLNIGNTSIDLSAFSPAAVPLIIGATIFEMTDGKSDTDGTPLFSAIIGSLCETIDPITEMSVISSFADAMGFSSYSNEEAQNTRTIFSFIGKGLSSYVGQYVPTVVSQIERTFDPYSRSYSAGDDYWASRVFGSDVGTFTKNIQNKVGLGWLAEPKMNVHGEEVTNYTNFGSWVWNALNQTILPASWKADNKNEIDYELVRLYGTVGDTGLFPTKPSRNVGSYTDSETRKSVTLKLTNDTEYMEYQRDYGQAVYDALDELLASPEYGQMTDDERALAIEDAIENAKKAIRNVWKAKMIERNSK